MLTFTSKKHISHKLAFTGNCITGFVSHSPESSCSQNLPDMTSTLLCLFLFPHCRLPSLQYFSGFSFLPIFLWLPSQWVKEGKISPPGKQLISNLGGKKILEHKKRSPKQTLQVPLLIAAMVHPPWPCPRPSLAGLSKFDWVWIGREWQQIRYPKLSPNDS